jgi:hypothetical protein
VDPASQPFEQHEVRAIADRVASRVQANDQIEPEDGADDGDLAQVERPARPAFETPDRRMRATHQSSEPALAQPRGQPREPYLPADGLGRFARDPQSPMAGLLSRSHRHILSIGA